MARPSEADHPMWKEALTYRELLKALLDLSQEQLDEAVTIEEPNTVGRCFHLPIHAFHSKPKRGLGIGPYLSRKPMSQPQPTIIGNIIS